MHMKILKDVKIAQKGFYFRELGLKISLYSNIFNFLNLDKIIF